MRFAGGLGRVSLASSPFQGRNSQKGSQLKKAAFHVETSKNITNVLYSTLDMIETKVTILEPPQKNAHMSHYSESIFFQSRCAATRLNRSKPIKASGICGSQGHWRRKSWWEKRSRGNPPLPIRNPHSMPKMLDRVRRSSSSSSLCSECVPSSFIGGPCFPCIKVHQNAHNKLQDPRPLQSCKPWRPARETW